MVSIILTTAIGAVLNAATFIGGSYLARSLSGKDQDKERKRHDLALEKYNNDYIKWKEEMSNLELWKEEEEQKKDSASHKLSNTDDAFRLYAKANEEIEKKEPQFENYYTPSSDQRNGEVIFTGLTVAGLVFAFSKLI